VALIRLALITLAFTIGVFVMLPPVICALPVLILTISAVVVAKCVSPDSGM
jgi:hypothetical protein